jgi:hypothetical protein
MNAEDFSQLTDEQLQNLLKHAASEVLALQDACNLSGVIFTWATTMHLICEISNRGSKGTEWKNHHPINQLFACKVAELTCYDGSLIGDSKDSGAYAQCQALAA